MNYLDTSLEAWKSIQGTLNKRQRQVYKIIQDHPLCSDKEIASFGEIPINQVTPRRGELQKKERIIYAGCKTDPTTGRQVRLWFAPKQKH